MLKSKFKKMLVEDELDQDYLRQKTYKNKKEYLNELLLDNELDNMRELREYIENNKENY